VVTDKAPQKNRSHLQVMEGGLDDSDVDATNPFSRQVTSKVQRPQAEASKAVGIKRDLSRRNEVRAQLQDLDQISADGM